MYQLVLKLPSLHDLLLECEHDSADGLKDFGKKLQTLADDLDLYCRSAMAPTPQAHARTHARMHVCARRLVENSLDLEAVEKHEFLLNAALVTYK